jgi:hypothetical protein
VLRRVSTKPQRFQGGSAGSAGCGLRHSLTVLCVVKSIGHYRSYRFCIVGLAVSNTMLCACFLDDFSCFYTL